MYEQGCRQPSSINAMYGRCEQFTNKEENRCIWVTYFKYNSPPLPNPKENVKFFKFDALSVIWFVKNQAKILDSALICDQSHVSFFENKHPFNKILLLWLKKGHAKIAL